MLVSSTNRKCDIDEPEELVVGRHVCFEFSLRDSEATTWTQGIVKKIEQSTCHVLRIQDPEGSGLLVVQKESAFVMKDTVPWTLRFQKDDDVVFYFSKKKVGFQALSWIRGQSVKGKATKFSPGAPPFTESVLMNRPIFFTVTR